MDLKNIDMLAFQTKAMQQDKTTKGICAGLSPQMQQLANDTDLILLWSNIDNLPEAVVDELAWALHIEFYDNAADLATKREAVKAALIIHQTKGTPYAVEKLISVFFGFGVLQEWFDYGGVPGYFKITIDNPDVLTTKYDQFIAALETVKRKSSKLESINFAGSFQFGDAATAPELDADKGFSDDVQSTGGAFAGVLA